MNFPEENDYIDIHTHEAGESQGIFSVETLMAHEGRVPENRPGIAYISGIHPWYLNENNHDQLLADVLKMAGNPLVIAIGEAGFDKIKGPDISLQQKTFGEQVRIAEEYSKPIVIHCVRAWEELVQEHKRFKPEMPWLVHGFRGKPELGLQLISKGMYLSFWFDFIMKPESARLIRSLPIDRIFLETDGSDADIRDIYNKVSEDLGITGEELKKQILNNFRDFFKIKI
jgi:TatD DNase family protein